MCLRSFIKQVNELSRPALLVGAAAASVALAGLFTSIQMYMTRDNLPRTVTPLWKEQTLAYRKFQKADPVFQTKL